MTTNVAARHHQRSLPAHPADWRTDLRGWFADLPRQQFRKNTRMAMPLTARVSASVQTLRSHDHRLSVQVNTNNSPPSVRHTGGGRYPGSFSGFRPEACRNDALRQCSLYSVAQYLEMERLKVVPFWLLDSTHTLPPCCWAISFTMVRPSPAPSTPLEVSGR
jgi:hypothetical protein